MNLAQQLHRSAHYSGTGHTALIRLLGKLLDRHVAAFIKLANVRILCEITHPELAIGDLRDTRSSQNHPDRSGKVAVGVSCVRVPFAHCESLLAADVWLGKKS